MVFIKSAISVIGERIGGPRPLTTKELLDMVEDIQFWEADIYITPPADGHESVEDSEDDESPIVDIISVVGNWKHKQQAEF
ncbi:unnamed protein product [Callosobruchus maculatus]|uniref:Uncharacterized protein n=1 Tax=Callosobruchus maculatus TaxID=64391 RepID=A0A653DEZ6_CALMS|nr:unnamed protein product [Callosobruchus maculatus]